jgi:hypothetical protein
MDIKPCPTLQAYVNTKSKCVESGCKRINPKTTQANESDSSNTYKAKLCVASVSPYTVEDFESGRTRWPSAYKRPLIYSMALRSTDKRPVNNLIRK